MPKITVTFEGDSITEAMDAANRESTLFIHSMQLAIEQATATGILPPEKGNGEAKDDTIIHQDKILDNEAVLHCALDLLMTIYSSDDKGSLAVNALLEKYSVDSLNDVEPERASELFKDAEKLASDFGVSN